MMRWNPPETLGPYMDDPITLDIGALVIGVCCIVGAWVMVLGLIALTAFTLQIVGWR